MNHQPDYLILIMSPDASTILADPLGPAAYSMVPADPADPTSPLRVDFFRGAIGWRTINLGPRSKQAGTGSFTALADAALMVALTIPEVRAVVVREPDGDASYIEMAGPVENVELDYQAGIDGTDGPGTVQVTFSDDLSSLAYRLVYPDPTEPADDQPVTKYTITTTNAEDAARALVNLNAGPGALTARKYAELALGADHGVGTSISTSFVRSVTLMDALRSVLLLGGNLGMRATQDDDTVRFEVYEPQDRSATVWFSRALGNIRDLKFTWAAPTATVAVAGDDQAGVDRIVVERSNSAALSAGWRRKELWVDARSAANLAEVQQAADEALADTGPTVKVSVTAVETPSQRYRANFGIDDTVSVEVYDGFVIQEIVRGVDITVTPDAGEVITPLIGVEDTDIDLKAAEITRLKRRLAQIEGAL